MCLRMHVIHIHTLSGPMRMPSVISFLCVYISIIRHRNVYIYIYIYICMHKLWIPLLVLAFQTENIQENTSVRLFKIISFHEQVSSRRRRYPPTGMHSTGCILKNLTRSQLCASTRLAHRRPRNAREFYRSLSMPITFGKKWSFTFVHRSQEVLKMLSMYM
jgi:hypothetical protein